MNCDVNSLVYPRYVVFSALIIMVHGGFTRVGADEISQSSAVQGYER